MYRTTQTVCRLSARRALLARPSAATRRPATPLLRGIATQPVVQGTGPSHFVAGVAGGSAVLLAGYGYYRYSGAADVVAAAQKTVDAAKAIQEKAPSPSAAGKAVVNAIKAVSPGFVAVIPGLDDVLNKGLSQLDELAETHGDEVNELVHKMYADLQKLSKKGFNEDTLKEAVALIQERLKEAQKLGVKIGSDATDKVLESNPELKKSVESGINELKDMVDSPEVEKILHDTYAELKKMADKGFSPEAVIAAGLLVKKNVAKAQQVAGKVGDAAWDKAAEAAKPYLDKMPEVQKLLEGKLDDVKKIARENGGPEAEKIITDLYDELKKISEKGVNKKTIAEASKLVESKVAEAMKLGGGAAAKASDFAWDKAAEAAKPYLDKMPEVKKLMDGKLGDLQKLAEKNGGPELQKIVEDLYAELKKIADKGINKDSIAQAKKVTEAKLKEASDIASKAGGKVADAAWQKAAETATPLLEKAPEFKKLVDANISDIKKVVEKRGAEGEKLLQETYEKIAKIAEKGVSKSSLADLKKVMEEQAAKAKKLAEKAGDDAAEKTKK
ncbi:hypothetical protein BDZ88DRAFT_420433 [Geranomyces variabilis]|nr:hypothetical protein BDZ88DRAFT_420433 [Geranomyces variabilis]KAJ3139043.1 hypothetical protein HDU90_000949 [Geranomyces variabilis]